MTAVSLNKRSLYPSRYIALPFNTSSMAGDLFVSLNQTLFDVNDQEVEAFNGFRVKLTGSAIKNKIDQQA